MNYMEILNSQEAKDYIAISQYCAMYYADKLGEPGDITAKYEKALDRYRDFLDRNGLKMPKSTFLYKKNDKSTHKYLDSTYKDKDGKVHNRTVDNPNWKYKQ